MLRWITALFICLVIISGLGFVKYTQVMAAIAFGESFPEPSETVNVIQTEVTDWQAQIEVIGEIVPPQSVVLRNELEGIITAVNFQSGGRVSQGEVILQLDIREETAQLAGVQAEIKLAQIEVTRLERLLKVNAGSEDQLDRAKAQRDIAQARAVSLQATINRKSIIAPFDGVAGLHRLEKGQFLTSNSVVTELVGITESLWVDFALPQQYAQIAENAVVKVQPIDQDFAPINATVIAKNARLENQSRSLQIRALVDNTNQQFLAGEVVEISVPQANSVAVIELPITAVRVDSFGNFIYVLVKDDKNDWRAERKPVELVHRNENSAMIAVNYDDGVSAGLIVATTGSYKLRPGLLTYVSGE